MTIKKVFHAKYNQVILKLEAQQMILCLCSAHWKADAMLDQVLLWQSEVEAKAPMNDIDSTSSKCPPSKMKDIQPSEPCPVFIPHVSDVRPVAAMKQVLELSPGPKSPSTLHTQKHSKEHCMVSMQKMVGLPRGSDHKYYTHTWCEVWTTDALTTSPCVREPTLCRTKTKNLCLIPYQH